MRNEIARGFRVRYRVIGGNKNRWVETPVMENDSEIAFNFNDIVAYDTLTKVNTLNNNKKQTINFLCSILFLFARLNGQFIRTT